MPRPGLEWKRNKRPRCTISLKQDRGPWISYSECPPPMSISLTFCPDRSAHYASVGDEADQARSVPADDYSKSRAGSCLRCSWSEWCSSATLQILHCTPYSPTLLHNATSTRSLVGLRCNFDLCSSFRGYGVLAGGLGGGEHEGLFRSWGLRRADSRSDRLQLEGATTSSFFLTRESLFGGEDWRQFRSITKSVSWW